MGLTGFNRARREAEVKADIAEEVKIDTEEAEALKAAEEAEALRLAEADEALKAAEANTEQTAVTNTSETKDGTTPAGSEPKDIAEPANDLSEGTGSAVGKSTRKKAK
jgi:hypothetical protein